MERKEGLETGIRAFVEDNLEEGVSAERIVEKLQKRFGLAHEHAVSYLERFGRSDKES
ncbi:hypothetical protein GPL15_04160 [Clostridium sp. MCC353]|uniref:hypothetical protein n=1 Tax=Clostridium sp. MCC353 TaxID=2592646 RepID=UPI001C0385A2|nr:hypothetical protein [Clostridium sp. MCC353]MBT9775705.1 hypothetical protein [Clostridium sp. MCC353]